MERKNEVRKVGPTLTFFVVWNKNLFEAAPCLGRHLPKNTLPFHSFFSPPLYLQQNFKEVIAPVSFGFSDENFLP